MRVFRKGFIRGSCSIECEEVECRDYPRLAKGPALRAGRAIVASGVQILLTASPEQMVDKEGLKSGNRWTFGEPPALYRTELDTRQVQFEGSNPSSGTEPRYTGLGVEGV